MAPTTPALAAGFRPPPVINTLPLWQPGSGWTTATSRPYSRTLADSPAPTWGLYEPMPSVARPAMSPKLGSARNHAGLRTFNEEVASRDTARLCRGRRGVVLLRRPSQGI